MNGSEQFGSGDLKIVWSDFGNRFDTTWSTQLAMLGHLPSNLSFNKFKMLLYIEIRRICDDAVIRFLRRAFVDYLVILNQRNPDLARSLLSTVCMKIWNRACSENNLRDSFIFFLLFSVLLWQNLLIFLISSNDLPLRWVWCQLIFFEVFLLWL